jgi:hypothetical protein
MYDLQAQTLKQDTSVHVEWIERSFLAFYTIELMLKLANHRLYFFCNEDMSWNIFDFVLVGQALQDEVIAMLLDGDGGSFAFARMLKLLKLGKVFRMLRALRFLKELRVMIQSIVGSAMSMLWSFVMMSLILYLFSLVFVSQLNDFLIEYVEDSPDGEDKYVEDARTFFGSVGLSMLTLFMSASGGVDWVEPYTVLQKPGDVFLPSLFLMYILFWTFAVMNILGGIFL